MADSVVTVLLDYLSGLLKEEANFLDGVEDKVSSLYGELKLINIFLKNSEGKRNDEIVKEIVRQIREVAYEAEDVIDTFIFKVAEHRRRSRIGRILRLPSHTKMLRTVGRKITNIQEKINKIYNNKERYGIERVEATENAVEEEATHRRRREVEEDDVVGFVDDTATLVKQLTGGDRNLHVISIIGMGGLGKTTLAKKLYNNLGVMRHFNCHVWVSVSQDFRIRELLLTISKVLRIDPKDKSDDELKRKLFKYLKGKRYLVVMDDVWRTKVWDEVCSTFPNNSNGSRILITSRKKKVALHASPSLDPYSLSFLNHNESWELFKKKVFRGKICPPELENLGKQIAEGCRGLPLSIVVLAGILANKEKSIHMWSKFIGHVTSFLTRENDTTICEKILFLSYTDLPQHLKPCFLYFGIYPEDFEIEVRQLMHLWVAEGFVQHTGHRILEDFAELYLEELIDRSLIQVASRRTDGGVKKCRIHDLLRELCISEGAKETFLEARSADQSTSKSRRLSIQGDPLRYMSLNPSVITYARSLFLFDEGFMNRVGRDWLLKNVKLVRVLHIWRVEHSVIGKSVATFIHLRYLAIEISAGIVFPDSIDNLMNLETLYVRGRLIEGCLPKGIFKLLRLRNLYIGPDGWLIPCDSEEALGNLQVLSEAGINYDPKKNSLPVVPDKFPNVRKLKIRFVHLKAWSLMINEMNEANLEVVSFPDLHHLRHLEILRIESSGWPMLLPGYLNSISSRITKLTLDGVVIRVDGVTVLGNLPNLLILKLEGNIYRSSDGSSIHVVADLFPRLKFLKLSCLQIREWKHERGAMPCLEHLVISRCSQFTSPPQLLSLSTLRYVEVYLRGGSKLHEWLIKASGFQLIEPDQTGYVRMVRKACVRNPNLPGGSQA